MSNQERRDKGMATERAKRVGDARGCTQLARRLGVSRQRAHQMFHPEQLRARMAVQAALAAGVIKKPSLCSHCGTDELLLEAHHPDHMEPLQVEWLCPPCHKSLLKGRTYTMVLPTPDGLVSQQQASVILGVTRQRVGQMMDEGLLTPVPLAGHRLLMAAQVQALKEKREAVANQDRKAELH